MKATQGCSSFIPIVVISKQSISYHDMSLGSMVRDLTYLFRSIKEDINSFRFLFTKFVKREDPDEPLDVDKIDELKEKIREDLNLKNE